ncbi:MAG: GNAT family N-acetyltransferase [Nanobdellota archaeon]
MEIISRLPKRMRKDALEIYHDAFFKKERLKFLPSSKKQAMKIYEKGADFRSGLYALEDGKVIGVLGLQSKKRRLINYRLNSFLQEFGIFGGLFRRLWSLFSDILPLHKDELKIDAVAVDEGQRGRGIGTKLIAKAREIAKRRSYKRLVLNVVNTNPKAERLYKRLGFRTINKRYFGFITKKAGYTSLKKMALDL